MESQKSNNPERVLLGGLEYTIPEGFEAEIKDRKIIVRKKETAFERVRKELLAAVEKGRVFDIDQSVADRWVTFLEGLESIGESSAKNCAISFIEFLDKNSYEGKMCVSNPECEDIVNAFVEKDWAKLFVYANKYIRGAAEGRTVSLSSKCQEWIDAVECVAGAFPPGSKGYDMVIGSIHDLIKYLKSPFLENRLWSKEDDKMIDRIMGAVTGYHTHRSTQDTDEMMDWLRDLRRNPRPMASKPNYCHHEVDETGWTEEYRKAYYDGWNNCNQQHSQLQAEQKPAEWGEEDEEMINALIRNQEILIDSASNERLRDTYSKEIQWLKSLRPQPNNNLRWRRATEGQNLPESIIIPDGEEPRFGKCAVKNSYYIPVEELKNLPKDGND